MRYVLLIATAWLSIPASLFATTPLKVKITPMHGGKLQFEMKAIDSTWGLYLVALHFSVPPILPCPACSALAFSLIGLHSDGLHILTLSAAEPEYVRPSLTSSKPFVIRAIAESTVTVFASVSLYDADYNYFPLADSTLRFITMSGACLRDSSTFRVVPITLDAVRDRYWAERRAAGDSVFEFSPSSLAGCPDSIVQLYVNASQLIKKN